MRYVLGEVWKYDQWDKVWVLVKPRGIEIKSPVRWMIFEHLLCRAWWKRGDYRRGYRYLCTCLSLKLSKFRPSPLQYDKAIFYEMWVGGKARGWRRVTGIRDTSGRGGGCHWLGPSKSLLAAVWIQVLQMCPFINLLVAFILHSKEHPRCKKKEERRLETVRHKCL